jgi:hypothetical protein
MTTIITLAELVTTSTVDDVLALELSVATQLNLPVTSWQPLDPSRTILQVNANLVSQESAVVAGIAQGGFASYAAIMPAGITDSNDGAGYMTAWMDLVSTQVYNTSRVEPSAASGGIPVQNITATGQTYAAGQLHFQHPTSGATYTNTSAGTIAPAASPPTPVQSTILVTADPAFVGPIGTLSTGQTAILLTPFPGVTPVAQPVGGGLVGSPIETNAHLLARCEAKLGALSPNGAASAYQYIAESLPVFGSFLQPPSDIADYAASTSVPIATAATALLAALGFNSAGSQQYTAPTSANPWGVTAPATRVSDVLNIGSGVVDVYAANAAGGLTGCAQLAITNVSWSGGTATVTTASAHGLGPGAYFSISGVLGATGVNNQIAGNVAWLAATASGSTITFALALSPGSYTSGGVLEGGDLGMVDAAIQAQIVPTGQAALVQAATNVPISVAGTAYIPTKAGITATTAIANIVAALTAYFDSVPIGGVTAEGAGIVPSSEILVTCANANAGTVSFQLTTPSLSADTTLTVSEVPVLGSTSGLAVIFV